MPGPGSAGRDTTGRTIQMNEHGRSTQIAVFRLTADLAVLFERVSVRERGGIGEPLHREMAERHVRVQAGLGIAERVIEADSRTPNQLAREILRLSDW